MNWLQRSLAAYREILNWFFIRRTVKRAMNSPEWKKMNLRVGYLSQIYTVINLRQEDIHDNEMVQRMRVMEKIEPIAKYLDSLGLSEVVYPEIVKIPESRSWLVVFWPLTRYFSIWRLLLWLSGLSLSIYLLFKWEIL